MKETATLGLEGKLNFIREEGRVGLTEGRREKHRGMKEQAQGRVNSILGSECAVYVEWRSIQRTG